MPDGHVLPEAEVHAGLNGQNGADSLTWLGHASFLIRLDGRTVLTDPFLSDHASPVPPFGPKRFAPPALRPDELPPIDVDPAVAQSLRPSRSRDDRGAARTRQRIQVVVPLRLGGYFSERGYPNVRELDWHQRTVVHGLEVTALPAIHFSKRTLFDRNQTLWTGYVDPEPPPARAISRAIPPTARCSPSWRPGSTGSTSLCCRSAPTSRALLMQGSHTTPEEAVQIGARASRRAHRRHALGLDRADRRAAVRAARALPPRRRRRRLAGRRRLGLRIGETRRLSDLRSADPARRNN